MISIIEVEIMIIIYPFMYVNNAVLGLGGGVCGACDIVAR